MGGISVFLGQLVANVTSRRGDEEASGIGKANMLCSHTSRQLALPLFLSLSRPKITLEEPDSQQGL